MDVFNPEPPIWAETAVHAYDFCCPNCRTSAPEAEQVWLNRRSPVLTHDQRRKWQEFYHCSCGTAWWGWSDERPPSELLQKRSNEKS